MRVLIAEDEMLSLRMLARDVQKLGFEVEAAEDGQKAWEAFEQGTFQMVVTDWNMPRMSGLDLIRRIRAMEREEYVYLILLTGRTEKTDLIEGMEAGADDFIAKPFEKEELRVRLRAGERMLTIQHAMARQKKELEVWRAKAEKTTEELKRSNADLDQFAHAASHDLRAPLNTQESFAGLLAPYKGRLDPDANDAIDRIIEKSAETMKEILKALREHALVGGRDKEIVPVDCSVLIGTAVANLQAEITASNSLVSVAPLPTVPCVETEVMRLFQNLVGNALKYREPDKSVKVDVGARREGAYWLFWVFDDGIGFLPEQTEKIFGAGVESRLHSAKKYPGTGFGLAFCRKVVERHGGRIWAESEPGKGSKFFFTLPAEQAAS